MAGARELDSFNAYLARYGAIRRDFLETVSTFGLPFATAQSASAREDDSYGDRVEALAAKGAQTANSGKSVWTQWKSPACVDCIKGVGTETFLTSTKCPRNCFFCFNPNQENYEFFLTHANPIAQQLEQRYQQGAAYRQLAITGGEPLLHLDEVLSFLETARRRYPEARTRLYTSAFGWTDKVRDQLEAAGLDEVRFSVKQEDSRDERERVLNAIGSSVGHFDAVMVEMPVMPDARKDMEQLLMRLDSLGVTGLNLLELCFPFHNVEEFAVRGYELKPSPYRVLYDYWYGGGLPVAGSEEACLDLVEFALDQSLSMGVHYCSLENKLTGQVYQQNAPFASRFPLHRMSSRDYFLKSAKVFGSNREAVRLVLNREGRPFKDNDEYDFTEFSLEDVALLQAELPDVGLAVCYAICEPRDGEVVLRELDAVPVAPATFGSEQDW